MSAAVAIAAIATGSRPRKNERERGQARGPHHRAERGVVRGRHGEAEDRHGNERGGGLEHGEGPEAGRDALAAAQAQPDRVDVAEDGDRAPRPPAARGWPGRQAQRERHREGPLGDVEAERHGARGRPALRSTFVAPTLPLPTRRTSATPNARATRKLNGIDPIRYAVTITPSARSMGARAQYSCSESGVSHRQRHRQLRETRCVRARSVRAACRPRRPEPSRCGRARASRAERARGRPRAARGAARARASGRASGGRETVAPPARSPPPAARALAGALQLERLRRQLDAEPEHARRCRGRGRCRHP